MRWGRAEEGKGLEEEAKNASRDSEERWGIINIHYHIISHSKYDFFFQILKGYSKHALDVLLTHSQSWNRVLFFRRCGLWWLSVTMHSLHFAVLNSLQKIKTSYLPWLLTFCHFSYLRKCGNNDRLLLCSVLQYRKKKAQRKHLSEKLSRWWGKKGNCFIMV